MENEDLLKKNTEYKNLLREIFYSIDNRVETINNQAVILRGPSNEELLVWWERIQKVMLGEG